MHIIIMSGIFMMQASALNLIYGYAGQLSLGHQAFWGISGYTSALLALKLGWSFWICLPAAGIFALVTGAFIGFITLRLRGPYFIILTICFSQVMYLISLNWIGLTNGPMGIIGIPVPQLHIPPFLNLVFSSKIHYYYLLLGLMIITIIAIRRLVNSHIGRAWIAIRENEDLAESVGIKAYAYKIMAFAISAFIVGLTGSFYAHYVTFISPEMFNFFYVINMLVILIAGGKGTIMGPIIGALIFTALPEYLRGAQAYRMPVYAVILLVVVIFMPKGIVPMVGNIAPRFMKKIRR